LPSERFGRAWIRRTRFVAQDYRESIEAMSSESDVIVIGAGPSGLMAALSASQGTPFWASAPEKFGRVLVLEEHTKPGGIAAFGQLSITNNFVLKGGQLNSMLLQQARELPIDIRTGVSVTAIRSEGEDKVVDSTAGSFRAKAVIVACGIFSHLRYLKFSNTGFLAETLAGQQAVFELAAKLAEYQLLEDGTLPNRKILIAGSHASLADTVERLQAAFPVFDFQMILDSRHDSTDGALASRIESTATIPVTANEKDDEASPAGILSGWCDGESGANTDFLAMIFDYNTYKIRPDNAVRFSSASGLTLRDGYIVADHWGRTNVPCVWACGNAVFPVSGVLQALYTGFVAGLSSRSGTRLAAFDEENGFLPWLAIPNSIWSGWLAPAKEIFR
jgi:thioredoxin reductase